VGFTMHGRGGTANQEELTEPDPAQEVRTKDERPIRRELSGELDEGEPPDDAGDAEHAGRH